MKAETKNLKQKQVNQNIIKLICCYFLFLGIVSLIVTIALQYKNIKYRDELVSIAEAINESELISEIDVDSNIGGLYSEINSGIIEIYYQYMVMIPIKQILEYTAEDSYKLQESTWQELDKIDESIYKLCNKIENIEYVQEDLVYTLPFLRAAIDNKEKLLLTDEELTDIKNTDKSGDIILNKMTAITNEVDTLKYSKAGMELLVLTTLLVLTNMIMVMSISIFPLIIISILLFKGLWQDKKVVYKDLKEKANYVVQSDK